MKSHLVSYATERFRTSQGRLTRSAKQHGVHEVHTWNKKALEGSVLYKTQPRILNAERGAGYWLWKPFIIKESLKNLGPKDVLIYSDSGIEVIGDLSPLFCLVRRKELLLFQNHYDDFCVPSQNLCGKWTKRDCFVLMDCDEPRYHKGRMLDASFLVLMNTPLTRAFVTEWFLYCCQPHILTDRPNACGLPNLPEFFDHRHDQSVLSLLGIRSGLETFRHPSQIGNHLKMPRYRQAGEWIWHPYGSKGICRNSPYPTLLSHHRGAFKEWPH